MSSTYPDSRSLALTAESPEAAEAWDRTVRSYLGMRRDTGDRLKEAYAADADMPMAHCLRGYFMLLFSETKRWASGRKSLAAAQQAAAARPVTAREAAHIAALERWVEGDMKGATALWDGILTDHPHDILAMRLAHYTHFYSGDAPAMRDSLARIMHAWDPTVPDYGFVAGCYAFALEEDGDYARAEQRGREAVGINPNDPWGTHAVAHVMEMQGRQAEGIAWLSGLEPHWTQVQNFRFHLWWHRSLFHIELGDCDAVLDLYDRGVREEETGDYLDLTNAIALLWRLESEGVDVGDRWQEVANHCAEHTDRPAARLRRRPLCRRARPDRRQRGAGYSAGGRGTGGTGRGHPGRSLPGRRDSRMRCGGRLRQWRLRPGRRPAGRRSLRVAETRRQPRPARPVRADAGRGQYPGRADRAGESADRRARRTPPQQPLDPPPLRPPCSAARKGRPGRGPRRWRRGGDGRWQQTAEILNCGMPCTIWTRRPPRRGKKISRRRPRLR